MLPRESATVLIKVISLPGSSKTNSPLHNLCSQLKFSSSNITTRYRSPSAYNKMSSLIPTTECDCSSNEQYKNFEHWFAEIKEYNRQWVSFVDRMESLNDDTSDAEAKALLEESKKCFDRREEIQTIGGYCQGYGATTLTGCRCLC
jgi:hypothetical protein